MTGERTSVPRVFISYRRADDDGYAGRLHDRLAEAFGEPNVFMDVDSIPVGADFATSIEEAVASCDALLVVIGPNWLAADSGGVRRLDLPEDFVRVEIETAFNHGVRVVPVLVKKATLPRREELPQSLAPLTRRQALELGHGKFRVLTAELVDQLRMLKSGDHPTPADATSDVGGPESTEHSQVHDERPSEPVHAPQPGRFTVTVLSQSSCALKLLVARNASHLVEVDKCKMYETVAVDGRVIQRKLGGLDRRHEFVIDDAGTVAGGVLTFETTWTGDLRDVVLNLGGVVVFEAPGKLPSGDVSVVSGSSSSVVSGVDGGGGAGVAAGWYVDPVSRFELRYWDGVSWTDHVSQAGQQLTDSAGTSGDVSVVSGSSSSVVPGVDGGGGGGVPAGWYVDPSSRFELRYWDGVSWTDHVSQAGQQLTDSAGASGDVSVVSGSSSSVVPGVDGGGGGGVPAGWYVDPSSRFELRYWDGVGWTGHVSQAGRRSTDPLAP